MAEDGLAEFNSEYAEEGVLLHAALETGIADNLDEAGIALVDSTKQIFVEVIERAVAVMAIPPDEPFDEGFERALRVRNKLRTVMPGHCDFWRYYPRLKILIVIDAKFGFLEVTPAPLNLQLRSYAIMGFQEWDVETAIVAIAQPRAYMIDDAERLTIARYDRAELLLAFEQMLEHERAWLDPQAPRHASEDACRYCKATLTCPAWSKRLGPLSVAEAIAGIADLPEEDFARLFEAMRIASNDKVQDQIKEEARTRCMEGRLPGFRLKPNSPRRALTDQVAASRLLASQFQFTQDELAACSKITLGKDGVEQVLRKKTGCKAKDAPAMINDALAPVIERTTPAPSIIPISEHDKAKEV